MAKQQLNADQIDDRGGAWQDWTPTFTNVTVGNGTLDYANYTQIGKTVFAKLRFTLGSTSAITGAITFTLPVAPRASYGLSFIESLGKAIMLGSITILGDVFWTTSDLGLIRSAAVSGTNISYASTSATVPFTWATGHRFIVYLTYEAA